MRFLVMIELLALSGAVGFGVYCVSCALHVWHRRNAKSSDKPAQRGAILGLRRAAMVLLAMGVVGMVLSAAWNAIVGREGLLIGEGLFTVRCPDDLEVGELGAEGNVAKGVVLARYRSPRREAEIGVLRLRQQGLEIQEQLLTSEPLAVDSQITAQIAELSDEQQSLRTDLTSLGIEKDRVVRDYLREQLTKQDEIGRLQRTFDKLRNELQQAVSESRLQQADLARYIALRSRHAISEEQYADKENRTQQALLQVQKLEEESNHVQRDKAELERGLRELKDVSAQQSADLEKNVASLTSQLENVDARLKEVRERRTEDLTRAARHRRESHEQLDVERKQVGQQLAGLTQAMEVRAPFAGRVVYRASSPRSVHAHEPVLVLAAPEAFRFQIELPSWIRRSLEGAGAVPLEFLARSEREEERRFVRSRFVGTLAEWRDVPDHHGYGVAELRCEPAAESVLWLAGGERLPARLVWQPPLYAIPTFITSALAAILGLVGWGLVARWAARVRTDREPAVRELSAPQRPALGEVAAEYGAEGAMLRLLGAQLREVIVRGEPDTSIIAAAEWALDRHRARAVRLLAFGLSADGELREYVDRLLKVQADDDTGELPPGADERAVGRLVNILRVVCPDSVPAATNWLSWQRSERGPDTT
jgi:hypothetical protein